MGLTRCAKGSTLVLRIRERYSKQLSSDLVLGWGAPAPFHRQGRQLSSAWEEVAWQWAVRAQQGKPRGEVEPKMHLGSVDSDAVESVREKLYAAPAPVAAT